MYNLVGRFVNKKAVSKNADVVVACDIWQGNNSTSVSILGIADAQAYRFCATETQATNQGGDESTG